MNDTTRRDRLRHSMLQRRELLLAACTAPLAGLVPGHAAAATAASGRPIPPSGERLPLVGLGSWITFNVGNDREALLRCTEVMKAFFAAGGAMIDSSPMYGSSQSTIGFALDRLGLPQQLFSAEKVWVGDGERGARQIEASRAFWGVPRFDLMQVHNLLAWQQHLPRLFAMKAAGQLRYVGITTSHGRRHDELESVMRKQPIDFVQLTYNPVDREVERRLLPIAAERGIAVIVNRPFQQGALLDQLQRHRLPAWAGDIDCRSWAQLVLKFIVAHPAVTCVIPATRQPPHVIENMAAAGGRMPDAATRRRIVDLIASL
ncbi:aldo/keto reductase [Piscinibacter sakaiensis]|uniref:aldo/keto reductase n=1 Tax=Piscinibacter sakaiensis TaxID=1547922 RepID=UPI003AAFFD92